MYYDFLEEHGDNFEQVFLTDIRDVIFQSDIFESFKDYQNYFCYATQNQVFRGSKTDYNWVVKRFGKNEADKFWDKKIICAGTVIGTTNEIKIFCQLIWDSVNGNDVWGCDQASMNYLIYNNLLPIENFIESDIFTGKIFTTSFAADIFTYCGDKICYGKNIPAVFHQYTLYEKLIRFVDGIYRDKNFQVDERFNDIRSIIEQTTSLLYADKIGAAIRLFMKKYLMNPDFGKYERSLMSLFKIAAKKPITQPLELLLLALQDMVIKNVRSASLADFSAFIDFLNRAKNLNIAVEPEFKKYLAGALHQCAKQAFDKNNLDKCLTLTDMLIGVDTSPDKDFYLFAAKVNRLAGRKKAALAAYKKVLELN